MKNAWDTWSACLPPFTISATTMQELKRQIIEHLQRMAIDKIRKNGINTDEYYITDIRFNLKKNNRPAAVGRR